MNATPLPTPSEILGLTVSDRPFIAGTKFGNYRIERCIGSGGMSSVYEAIHLILQKKVAVKVLHSSLAMNTAIHARFVREGEATSRIRHPNVVDVSDVGTTDGLPYLVMEYLEGETLQQLLGMHGALDSKTTANIMVPVIAGLAAAHAAGVLHRDLKPDNIVLARTHDDIISPKVIDFGVSKLLDIDHGQTAAGAVLGTPHYMAPEVILQRTNLDAKLDQYSLGVILYECKAGRLPFDGNSLYDLMNQIVSGVYLKPSIIQSGMDPSFEEIIVRAMSLDPANRFVNVKALGAALLPFASQRIQTQFKNAFSQEVERKDRVSIFDIAQAEEVSRSQQPDSESRDAWSSLIPSIEGQADLPKVISDKESQDFLDSSDLTNEIDLHAHEHEEKNKNGYFSWFVLIAGVLVTSAFIVWWSFQPRVLPQVSSAPPQIETYQVRLNTTPQNARIEIDGHQIGQGSILREFRVDGKIHRLRVQADGYLSYEASFQDRPPQESIILTRQRLQSDASNIASVDTMPPQPEETKVRSSRVSSRSLTGAGSTNPASMNRSQVDIQLTR